MPRFRAKCDIVTTPTETWAFFGTFSRPSPHEGAKLVKFCWRNLRARLCPFIICTIGYYPWRGLGNHDLTKIVIEKKKSTLQKHTSIADRPAAYLGGDDKKRGSFPLRLDFAAFSNIVYSALPQICPDQRLHTGLERQAINESINNFFYFINMGETVPLKCNNQPYSS